MIALVIGGTRSGKSEWAEMLAARSNKSVIYIATGTSNADDPEWQARIQQHRDRRSDRWQTLEVSIDLAQALKSAPPDTYLLVDSIGTWLANLIEQDLETWQQTVQEFFAAIKACQVDVTFVAEEVGSGVIPAYALGRLFRDRLGSLNRQLGSIADVVYLVTGGHALNLSILGEKLN